MECCSILRPDPGSGRSLLIQADLLASELAELNNPTLIGFGRVPFLQTAFQYPSGDPQHHQFVLAQPTIISGQAVAVNIDLITDFMTATPPTTIADDNFAVVAGSNQIMHPYVGLSAFGMPASLAIAIDGLSYETQLFNTKVLFKEGGFI